MNLGLIITMGTVSLGGSIVSKILGQCGKANEAQLVDLASLGMLGATAVGCVITCIQQLKKLG